MDLATLLNPNAGIQSLGLTPISDAQTAAMMANLQQPAQATPQVIQQPAPVALPPAPIAQPQADPGSLMNQIFGQMAQSKQAAQPDGGLISSILQNRLQPSNDDIARSITQTAQSYGDPQQFQAATPSQVAATRVQSQLAPYAQAMQLQNAAATAQYAQPMAEADLALKQAQAKATMMQAGGLFGGGITGGPGGMQAADGPHGDQFLSTLPPQTAGIVKALATGRMQFPGAMALKTPQWQQMMMAVSQYDPQFDAINYNARSGIRKDFTSGKDAQTINALNTGIGHLDQLQQAIGPLNNGQIPALNSLENWVSTQTGGTAASNFQAIKNSVAPELVRIWRGSGGSEGDIQGRLSDLDAAKTPDQLNGVIKELADLMKSKIDALGDQYQRGMGTAANDMNFYSPKSQQIFQKLGVDMGNGAAPSATSSGGQPNKVINFQDLP